MPEKKFFRAPERTGKPTGRRPPTPEGGLQQFIPQGIRDDVDAFFRGTIGDQDPGSGPAALGAVASLLPVLKALGVRIPGSRPGPELVMNAKGAKPPVSPDVEKEIQLFQSSPTPGSMAEFTPVGAEPERVFPRFPDRTPPSAEALMESAGRQQAELAKLKANITPPTLRKPRDPRASGMVPGEFGYGPDAADLAEEAMKPKHVPAFRPKSEMAKDVLKEMSPTGRREAFSKMKQYPKMELDLVASDPETFVDIRRMIDNNRTGYSPERQAEFITNRAMKGKADTIYDLTGNVDDVIDDLATHFTGEAFDPFTTEGALMDEFNMKQIMNRVKRRKPR